MNLTCNSTLEDLRITSESHLVSSLTFHDLALLIGGASTLVAVLLSFYLMWMHALNYTKPREQRHIIRILLMVPIYASSSFLQIYYYWNAIYYQVMSDCYEAIAIASFFALLCHYIAPILHEQKEYFRHMQPIRDWVWPVTWFAACCGKQRGIWRTPASGLTWFNIIWIGIYQYCFIRVAMTITAVVTQHFHVYCESSNSPVFAHIWVLVIDSLAVTVAMYCVIQFYLQLRGALHEHSPFLKVLSIKLVIFLAFWQTTAISVATSSLNIVKANAALAYPDIKVGIPALLLCFEMALFALLHLWAFPYQPYRPGAPKIFYPVPDPDSPDAPPPRENEYSPPAGGPLGLKAFADALNLWDICKAFGRGVRWLFCGVKRRKNDSSYRNKEAGVELGKHASDGRGYTSPFSAAGEQKSTDHLPIADQFRRSTFGIPGVQSPKDKNGSNLGEESARLIAHAQPNPDDGRPWDNNPAIGHRSPSPYEGVQPAFSPYMDQRPDYVPEEEEDARERLEMERRQQQQQQQRQQQPQQWQRQNSYGREERRIAGRPTNNAQAQVGAALWSHGEPMEGGMI